MSTANEDHEATTPPHVVSEFFLWFWYRSATGQGHVDLPEGSVEFWVGKKLLFATPGEDRPAVTLTGDEASTSKEARVAVQCGKVLRSMEVCLRREEREYTMTLKAPRLAVSAAKLPALVKGGDEAEVLYERMFLYEELHFLLSRLFRAFAIERQEADYASLINQWVNEPKEQEDDGQGED